MECITSYTINDIINKYRDALSEQEDLLCKLVLSLYCYCNPSPSPEILLSVGLKPDNLDSIFDEEALFYLKENYAAIVPSLIKKLSHSPFADKYSIIEETAIESAVDNSFSKWEDVFVLGAGINHFLHERPEMPIFGIEFNPHLWGIGQIYLESQGWDNVIIFQKPSDIPWNRAFKSIVMLSTDADYFRYIKKGIGGSYELLAILPKEICFSKDYLDIRRIFLKTGYLKSITVVHTGNAGLAILYCLNSYKRRLKNTSSVSKRIALYAFHLLFPKMPGKGLLLLAAIQGIDFFFFSVVLLLQTVLPTLFLIPEPAISLMWGFSGVLFMVIWAACSIAAHENYNPQVQFAAVLDFHGATIHDWKKLMDRTLKPQDNEDKECVIPFHSSVKNTDEETVFSRYFVAQKSISESDMRAFVYVPNEDCQTLSSLISIISPSKIQDSVERPVLRIVGGHPLSTNYLNCEIDCERIGGEARRGFAPRYFIPGDTFLWCYSPIHMRVGHVSQEVALANSFFHTRTLLFSTKPSDIEKDFLLKELLSGFVHEQILWFGPRPSQDEMMQIHIRVPSIEQQNRELRADAFEYLEKEHNDFVSMVTNHKHEVGNLLKDLYYDFEILECLLEKNGSLSINQVVDKRKGTTVKDYFSSIDRYKTEIGHEMVSFWSPGYGKAEQINLKEAVASFVKTKATNRYSVEVSIPSETMVFFSQKGLFTILRNVFVNAEKHGFTDESRKDYHIIIWQEESPDQERVRLVVGNNGNPLPEGITSANMFNVGIGTGRSEHIGCHTIKEICEEFGGNVSFETNSKQDELTVSYILDIPKA